jgi:hypothetical protein
VKVIVASATGPVSVLKRPINPKRGRNAKVRVVGVGAVDGGGLVNPDDPEVMVFEQSKPFQKSSQSEIIVALDDLLRLHRMASRCLPDPPVPVLPPRS